MTDHEDDVLPPWTNEELALLRSAEVDAPSARSLPAALAAAGAGTAIAAASAGAQASAVGAASASAATGSAGTSAATGAAGASIAAAKWTASVALGKWIAVAAVSGAVVTGGIVLSKRVPASEHALPQLNQSAMHATPSPAPAQPAAPASTVTAVPADQPVGAPAAEPAHAPVRPARQSVASATATREPPAQPDIRLEIAALDSARASLRNGHARDALAALDRYDASFGPSAALQLEASTLRIEALAQAGGRSKAEALARTFLAAHPNTPYAARIGALLTASPAHPPAER